jgi:hypothetical protein
VGRTEKIIATRSRTAGWALATLLLGADGCFQSYAEADDDDADARIEADGAADTHAEADVAVEADAAAEVDIRADADDVDSVAIDGGLTCVGGYLDRATMLCWQDPPSTTDMDWEAAYVYCPRLPVMGDDPGSWHLPTISPDFSPTPGSTAFR